MNQRRRCELIERGLPIPEGLREGREEFRDHGPTTTTTTTAARGGGEGEGEEEEEGVRRRAWGFVYADSRENEASFRFAFPEAGIGRTNLSRSHLQKSPGKLQLSDAPRRAWCLKIFKIGKLRSVILFDALFQVIEPGDIDLVK